MSCLNSLVLKNDQFIFNERNILYFSLIIIIIYLFNAKYFRGFYGT